MQDSISKVPYLVDAMRNWAMDSGYTPYLTVEAAYPGVNLPVDRIEVKDGLVTLNVHDRALNGYEVMDEWLVFETRFSGTIHQVELPFESVISLSVPEVRNQVVFREYNPDLTAPEPSPKKPQPRTAKGKSHLRLVQ